MALYQVPCLCLFVFYLGVVMDAKRRWIPVHFCSWHQEGQPVHKHVAPKPLVAKPGTKLADPDLPGKRLLKQSVCKTANMCCGSYHKSCWSFAAVALEVDRCTVRDHVTVSAVESTGNRESSVELIKLDVSRTFPQLCIFQQVTDQLSCVFYLWR